MTTPQTTPAFRGRWIVALALLVLAAGAGAGVYLWRKGRPAAPPPAATAAPVFTGNTWSGMGKIRAKNVAPVPAPIAGTLEALEIEDGQEVAEGTVLARIASTRLDAEIEANQLELERAQARMNNLDAQLTAARLDLVRLQGDALKARAESETARKLYERQQLLLSEGATPRLVFEKAKKEYEEKRKVSDGLSEELVQAEGKVAGLVKNVDDARRVFNDATAELENAKSEADAGLVRSPVDGIVLSHRVKPGEEVPAGMEDLFTIATDLSLLEIVVDPPAAVLEKIKPGQAVLVQVAEAGQEGLSGQVREVKDKQVIIEFLSPDPAVRPGLTGQARIQLQ